MADWPFQRLDAPDEPDALGTPTANIEEHLAHDKLTFLMLDHHFKALMDRKHGMTPGERRWDALLRATYAHRIKQRALNARLEAIEAAHSERIEESRLAELAGMRQELARCRAQALRTKALLSGHPAAPVDRGSPGFSQRRRPTG